MLASNVPQLPSYVATIDELRRKTNKKQLDRSRRWTWLLRPNERELRCTSPFLEKDLEHFIENGRSKRPPDCPRVIVNRPYGRTRPDYRFDTTDSPTFEVKGPVRNTFFDLDNFGHNWTKMLTAKGGSIVKDVAKIRERCREFPDVPHYLVLLLCCNIIPPSFTEIMKRVAASNLPIAPYRFCYRSVKLDDGSGRDLTVAMTRITPRPSDIDATVSHIACT